MITKSLFSHSIIAYELSINSRNKSDLMSFSKGSDNFFDVQKSLIDFNEFMKSMYISKYGSKTIISEATVTIKIINEELVSLILKPSVGFFGQKFVAQDIYSGIKTKHDEKTAAMYQRQIYFFFCKNRCIVIFHRAGLSGSKTIFAEVYNDFLKSLDLHCNLELIMTTKAFEKNSNIVLNKLILETSGTVTSSDSVDNLKKKKSAIRKEVIIHLSDPRYKPVKKLLNLYKEKSIDQESLILQIKQNLDEKFDNTKIYIKIGKNYRKINLDQLYGMIGDYDITEVLDYDSNGIPKQESLFSIIKEYAIEVIDKLE